MRWLNFKNNYNPVLITWETKTAKFLYIEVSPSHIFKVKIDKVGNTEKEEVS